MLNHIDLKRGAQFIMEGQPYIVLEHSIVFKGRGSSVMQAKIKNMKTGALLTRTFHTGETFEEAELEKLQAKFVYANRGRYVFAQAKNPSKRFELAEDQLGIKAQFLVAGTIVEALKFGEEILDVALPVKMALRVKETPPGVKGDRAQSGTKTAVLETGAVIQVPLFVEQDEMIEVNTETGEYVRRLTLA